MSVSFKSLNQCNTVSTGSHNFAIQVHFAIQLDNPEKMNVKRDLSKNME